MIQIDIEMPKRCEECPLCADYDCIIHERITGEYYDGLNEQYAHCPLIMPSAEPKRGKWEITNLGAVGAFDSCSECKRVVKHKAPFYNYCPNCGADMRGKQNE